MRERVLVTTLVNIEWDRSDPENRVTAIEEARRRMSFFPDFSVGGVGFTVRDYRALFVERFPYTRKECIEAAEYAGCMETYFSDGGELPGPRDFSVNAWALAAHVAKMIAREHRGNYLWAEVQSVILHDVLQIVR